MEEIPLFFLAACFAPRPLHIVGQGVRQGARWGES
nr:MAG TPA: hypothetical protein [Caudoviricetes sp.]